MPDTFTTQLARGATKGRYAFVSLGCPKNLVDSERMLGMLQLDGYELVNDPHGADFAVVNTCGFIEAARQESFAAIDEMLELKRRGELRGVIVSGCLAERQKESLLEDAARDRSPRRRLRPRGSHQGRRPAAGRTRPSSGPCSTRRRRTRCPTRPGCGSRRGTSRF